MSTNRPLGMPIPDQISRDDPIIVMETEPGMQYYILEPTGIWFVVVHKNMSTRETKTWSWKSLVINTVLVDERGNKTYEYVIDGVMKAEHDLTTMRDTIAVTNLLVPKHRQIFGPLITEHVIVSNVPVVKIVRFCGFTRDGWAIPNEFVRVKADKGIQDKFKDEFERMAALVPNERDAKETMQDIIENTSIDHKFIFLAYSMIMPFMHALLEHTAFVPIFAARSATPHTGKTSMLLLITHKIWGVPCRNVLKTEAINSPSRFGSIYSFSTFAPVVDDAQGLSTRIQGDIKSMSTGEIDHQRNGINQELVVDKVLVSPVLLSYNTRPAMFSSMADCDRLIEVPCNTPSTAATDAKFKAMASRIIPGTIGRYIIEKTASWTVETITERFDHALDDIDAVNYTDETRTTPTVNCGNPRSLTAMKILVMGARMLAEFLDVDIDLDAFYIEAEKILEQSTKVDLDDIISMVITQITDDDEYNGDKLVRRKASWIKSEVKEGRYKKHDGHVYCAANYQDLKNHVRPLELPKSLEEFAEILSNHLPGMHFGGHDDQDRDENNKRVKHKSIFIPSELWEHH